MPWSAVDQARLDQLLAADRHSVAASAERLAGVSVWLADVGASAGELGACAGIGGAADRCAELAATIADRADEAGSLARDLRAVGARLEHLVALVVAHLGRAAQVLAAGGWGEPMQPPRGDDQVADRADRSVLDQLVDRHARALAPLRAVLAEAETAGYAAAGTHAWRSGQEVSRDWCPGHEVPKTSGLEPDEAGWCSEPDGPGTVGTWCSGQQVSRTWRSVPDEPGSGVWRSEPPPSGPAPVATAGDADRIWQLWRPLSSAGEDAPPATPPERAIAPGDGPVMPGTEGRRPGTDLGVRIAELPDAPTRRSGR